MKNPIERLAQIIHIISVYWVLLLALIIFVDVMGRTFFNTPLLGAIEIIKNSVVSITFLQLPLAIYRGGMIRTTLIYSAMPPRGQRWLRTLAFGLGLALFLGIAWSSWGPFVQAWGIHEYEGEGALRVPTYPVRLVVTLTSAFAGLVYAYLMMLDWTGRLGPDQGEAASSANA